MPEGRLASAAAVAMQRRDIAATGAQVISRVRSTRSKILHQYASGPMVAMEVNAAGLAQLQGSGLYVTRIMEDKVHYPVLYQSGPLVQADQAWALGFDGTGWTSPSSTPASTRRTRFSRARSSPKPASSTSSPPTTAPMAWLPR